MTTKTRAELEIMRVRICAPKGNSREFTSFGSPAPVFDGIRLHRKHRNVASKRSPVFAKSALLGLIITSQRDCVRIRHSSGMRSGHVVLRDSTRKCCKTDRFLPLNSSNRWQPNHLTSTQPQTHLDVTRIKAHQVVVISWQTSQISFVCSNPSNACSLV